jgi:alkylation response protein AidB-like acyl-CoA dehydrogenase
MDASAEKRETAESEQLILEMVDKFLEKEVKPHVRMLEHDDIYPAEIVEKMREMGLFGCIISREYGGLGLSTITYAKIIERMSSVWMSISGIINSHLIMSMVVQRHGTDDVPAEVRRGRTARRRGPDGTGLRDRSAECPDRRQAGGRCVRSQWPKELDHQQFIWELPGPPGQD